MPVTIDITPDDTFVCVRATGEVDVSNASELRDALDAQLERGVQRIEVDLAEVPYIDSTGIGVLVAFAHKAQEAGVACAVRNPQRNVLRVLKMLDVLDKLGADGAEG